MTLWLIFGLLLCVALVFVVRPLFRHAKRLTPTMAGTIIGIVALSTGLYAGIGEPGVPSGAGEVPDPAEEAAALQQHLQEHPNDVQGWLALAGAHEALKDYEQASVVYERVLELQPDQPTALFYGGYIAAGRGDTELAASRWEALLLSDAPENVRDSLERQINLWRNADAGARASSAEDPSDAIVTVSVALADYVRLEGDPTVFIIARDPAQPSPPIAVVRRRLSELPVQVSLSDKDAMVPGRNLSAFPRFELLARVSLGGGPIAKPGDWYGVLEIDAVNDSNVSLTIDRQIP